MALCDQGETDGCLVALGIYIVFHRQSEEDFQTHENTITTS